MKLLLIVLLLFPLLSEGQIITTIAGGGAEWYCIDGIAATQESLNVSYCLAVDDSGDIYFTGGNWFNTVRKISNTGIISTIAGICEAPGYSGDGGPATLAKMSYPYAIAVDRKHNVYVSEVGNSIIRKIDSNGIISTFAGGGTHSVTTVGVQATSVALQSPFGVSVDRKGNVYIANAYTVLKVDTFGLINLFAGGGSGVGDGGPATNAGIYFEIVAPANFAFDDTGNVYITESYGNRIRKVDTFGIITTVAGNGHPTFSGDGSLAVDAELNFPSGVDIDEDGNMYIADAGNRRIRKISTSGIISTVGGNGVLGFSGDGGSATSAELTASSIGTDHFGNIYLVDANNSRIRKISCVVPFEGVITGIHLDCVGESRTLSETVSGGIWSCPSGIATVNDSGVFIGVTVGSGIIEYHVANSCSSSTALFPIDVVPASTCVPLSVTEPLTVTDKFELFPNPSGGDFTIRIFDSTPENARITIANPLGQIIYSNSRPERQLNIDLHDFPAGIYFVTVNGTENKKFIKQ